MNILVRQASGDDAPMVAAILAEAAEWVWRHDGTTMWVEGELATDRVAAEVDAGLFVVAECGGVLAGAVKFQLQDQLFWPDLRRGSRAAPCPLRAIRLPVPQLSPGGFVLCGKVRDKYS